jgi:hypothetical protein
MRMGDIRSGWEVLTNDGHRLGTIREVGQHFLKVSGSRFGSAIFVPSSAIANVEHESVHLNIAAGEVDAMGWQQRPRTPDDLRTGPERDSDRDI